MQFVNLCYYCFSFLGKVMFFMVFLVMNLLMDGSIYILVFFYIDIRWDQVFNIDILYLNYNYYV